MHGPEALVAGRPEASPRVLRRGGGRGAEESSRKGRAGTFRGPAWV